MMRVEGKEGWMGEGEKEGREIEDKKSGRGARLPERNKHTRELEDKHEGKGNTRTKKRADDM